jgi:SSS family solute:Na+ symporter
MSVFDWGVLLFTLLLVTGYGLWRSRGIRHIKGFLLADRKMPWYHVGLSVMATQASAITFLSAPAQGYTDGLRFVQFYFGLPLAMIMICIVFIPIYQGLWVYTAYEYLEKRFDARTRVFTAFLFLFQRALSTGISLYAPALVLSTVLHVDITYTTLFMGGLVVLYTIYGGAKAVSHTQLLQMTVIFSGLFIAVVMIVKSLPKGIGLVDVLHVAGAMGRLNAIDMKFDLDNRYNIWSGIIGGFFLQLSYFGTDQSQVGRYLTGSSVTQSRLGLLMNGLLKIPMQFLILLTGVLVFTFYQFNTPPVFFNAVETEKVRSGMYASSFDSLNTSWNRLNDDKREHVLSYISAMKNNDTGMMDHSRQKLIAEQQKAADLKKSAVAIISKNDISSDTNDSNYIFLYFVIKQLPRGVVGLLIAIIFLSAMGATASGLNALTSTCVVDVYKRFVVKRGSEKTYLNASRAITALWGVFCIVAALYAGRLGNLIEAVNILGSIFYGTILGIFLTAFFLKGVRGKAVFYAAVIAEVFVIICWQKEVVSFLWLNLAGSLMVMGLAWIFEKTLSKT